MEQSGNCFILGRKVVKGIVVHNIYAITFVHIKSIMYLRSVK